jgi:protein arginine kinase activator
MMEKKKLCQDCRKREATASLTQIVNNEKVSLALCHECAAARGFHSPLDSGAFPLAEILSGMAKSTGSARNAEATNDLSCKTCGMTFDQFTGQGRFGCGDCYATFRPYLEGIMRKIHGASLHRGRNPIPETSSDSDTLPIREEERLDVELKKAIQDEDFERAAELRDKLKALREAATTGN